MKAPEAEHQVKAWTYQDILLESYRYAPGPAETLPRHSHEDYQFCLSLDFPGEYRYRGSKYDVPVGSLSIIHPGEMHSARDEPPARAAGAVNLVREYLHDNYADNVSLEELARRANLSPYHLNRIFSREVGLPPHRYLIAVRVGRARELLARGTPITRVATETGFADHSHLTRTFKRLVQVPPSRYLPQNSKYVQDSEATLRDTVRNAR